MKFEANALKRSKRSIGEFKGREKSFSHVFKRSKRSIGEFKGREKSFFHVFSTTDSTCDISSKMRKNP